MIMQFKYTYLQIHGYYLSLANNNKSKSINQRLGIVAIEAQPNYNKKESIDVNRYNEDLILSLTKR
jgi:hypothetical protein